MKFKNIPTWRQWKSATSNLFHSRDKAKLDRIDELIKKYHEVLDMGKMNILMELKDAIIDWAKENVSRKEGTGRLKAIQALGKVVIDTLEERQGWGRHQYLKAECIGYEIRTGDYNKSLQPSKTNLQGPWSDESERWRGQESRYQDEGQDIDASCDKLRTAIAAAFEMHRNYQ